MSRILVTGASGYLGTAITSFLEKEGNEVVELGRRPSKPSKKYVSWSFEQKADPKIYLGSKALIHCAWDFRERSWDRIQKINVEGTVRLFSEAQKHGVQKLIFISSMSSFKEARSLYGKAKYETEERLSPFGVQIIRPGLIYDHGNETSGGMMGALEKMVRILPIIPVLNHYRARLYLCDQTDLASLVNIIIAAPSRYLEGPFIAANQTPYTLEQILKMLAERTSKKRIFIGIPWQLPWVCIKALESVGFYIRTSSDSLLSLI
jgi:nucleoside-diphosphate-sugar epimerase